MPNRNSKQTPSKYSKKSQAKRRYKKYTSTGIGKNKWLSGLAHVANDVTSIYKMLNTERKHVYTELAAVTPALSSPSIQLLNGLQQGLNGSQRVGEQVKFIRISMNLKVIGGFSTVENTICRIMVFIDHQPNKAAPTLPDLLEDVTYPFMSFRNWKNRLRFKMLFDKKITLNKNGANGVVVEQDSKEMDLITKYDGTANPPTIAQITSNSIYMIAVSDQTVGADLPLITGYFKLGYIDN